jgi:hypothetical protein
VPFSVSRIKQLWPWLIEARFAWLTLGVIGAALIVSLRPHTSESVIRLTGLVLQLLGIGTVIWGISETRALFGHPSFAAKAKSWFERFPLRQRSIVLAASAASLAAATCKARGYVTQGPGPNPTVDTRLDALERNVSLIHERISSTEKEMDEASVGCGEVRTASIEIAPRLMRFLRQHILRDYEPAESGLAQLKLSRRSSSNR